MTAAEEGADRVAVTVLTARGAVRGHNEDSVTVGALSSAGNETAEPLTLVHTLTSPIVVAVADGLGGHNGGEVASGHAARRLGELTGAAAGPEAVEDLLRAIDAEITARGTADRELTGMGTTVAGLVLSADGAIGFNVGDSKVFKVDGGYLGQLSVDDSPGPDRADGEQVVTGIVTQTLGGGRPVKPHIRVDEGGRSGRWLLCSDGLTDRVKIGAIESVLADCGDDLEAARRLYAQAMAAGGEDNISLVLVRRTSTAERRAAEPVAGDSGSI
jgi:serine/threonine protein phosphatase PrpC